MRSFCIYLIAMLGLFLCSCSVEKEKSKTKPEIQKITIFLIGDSTCAQKKANKYPECGWGMKFKQFLNENAALENHAKNGRSSRSFRGEGLWNEPVLEKLKPGDYVFIQFGHNDQKFKSPDRYTNPFTGYRTNLERYVDETIEKGANPIILSPIVRRNFNEYGTLIDTHGEYPLVARMVADEKNIPFIDIQNRTEEFVIDLGPDKSKEYWNWLAPGESENFPNGVQDDTHLNEKGATIVSSMIVEELKKQKLLSKYLK